MNIKNCLICKKEFVPNKGVQKYCSKECYQKHLKKYMKAYNKVYRIIYKEKIRKLQKKYQESHKKQRKKYNQEHKKRIDELRIRNYHKHIEKRRKRDKERYSERREYMRIYLKIYYQTHKKEINEFIKGKLKDNIHFKLSHYLKTRICRAIKGNPKLSTTMKLVGCSIDFLKQWLEFKFKKGMTWQNYGKWHIDHIRPCASFDLSNPSEQRKCFHYTNLQPLWAEENLRKASKIIMENVNER